VRTDGGGGGEAGGGWASATGCASHQVAALETVKHHLKPNPVNDHLNLGRSSDYRPGSGVVRGYFAGVVRRGRCSLLGACRVGEAFGFV
jgi:hypothetical protein